MSDQTANPAEATHPEATITNAVQRCLNAWSRALADKAVADNKLHDPLDIPGSLRKYAGQAYRNALPFLSSPVQIDAFIACVAQGMALRAIDPQDGAKLLYAAQVALTSRRVQQTRAQQTTTQQTSTQQTSDHKQTPSPSPLPNKPSSPDEPSSRPESAPADAAEGPAFVSATPSPRAQTENHPKRPMTAEQQQAKERLEAWMQKHHHPAAAQHSAQPPNQPTR